MEAKMGERTTKISSKQQQKKFDFDEFLPSPSQSSENGTLKSKQKQKLTQFFSCSLEARNSVSNKRKVEGKFVKNRSIWTRREEGERFSINHKSSTLFPWVLMTILAEDFEDSQRHRAVASASQGSQEYSGDAQTHAPQNITPSLPHSQIIMIMTMMRLEKEYSLFLLPFPMHRDGSWTRSRGASEPNRTANLPKYEIGS